MLRPSLPLALLAAACAAPVLAQAPEAPAPTQRASDDDEVVCRVMKVTGSRLGARRTCMTRAQWRAARQDNRDETERAQRQVWTDFRDPATPVDP